MYNGTWGRDGGSGWLFQSPEHSYKWLLSNLENYV